MRCWLPIFCWVLLLVSCNQNIEYIDSSEGPEDSPPSGSLLSMIGSPDGLAEASEVPPFVKAYFMHTWVEALYSVPTTNRNPNPAWQSPLIDPVGNRVWCTDCHTSGQIDFERIPKQRVPMVDALENDLEFMADLMRKWVARLNSGEYGAREKLKGPVTCLTCHESNPAPE